MPVYAFICAYFYMHLLHCTFVSICVSTRLEADISSNPEATIIRQVSSCKTDAEESTRWRYGGAISGP